MNDGNIQENIVKSQIEQNFDNWYNDKSLESTVGDLINHEAFQAEGLLDDVSDVKVKHSVSDKLPTDTPLNETHTLGGYVTIENGEPVIYTNSSQAKELVEENLYHELQHARDLKNAYLNPNATVEERMAAFEAIQEVQDAVKAGDFEIYKNTQWERKADLNKDFLITKKKEYYDRQTTSNKGRSSDNNEVSFSHEGNDAILNGNRELGQGTSTEESLGNSSTTIQGAIGQPQQLKLDFSQAVETKQSTNDIVSGIVNGDVVPTTKADIEAIVSKVEQLNPEISGFKWENLTEDSAAFAKKTWDFQIAVIVISAAKFKIKNRFHCKNR